jgi:hypothetical protein
MPLRYDGGKASQELVCGREGKVTRNMGLSGRIQRGTQETSPRGTVLSFLGRSLSV